MTAAALFLLGALLLSACCSAGRAALSTVKRLHVEITAPDRGLVGPAVRWLLAAPTRYEVPAFVALSFSALLFGGGMWLFLTQAVSLVTWELPAADAWGRSLVWLCGGVVAVSAYVLFGYLGPMGVGRRWPRQTAYLAALPLVLLWGVLWPFVAVLARLGARAYEGPAAPSAGLFRRPSAPAVVEAPDEGSEPDLLANIMALSSVRVKESMVPRTEIVAVEAGLTLDQVRETFIASGHSKLPVYRTSIDDIVGIAFAYDLFQNPSSVEAIMRPVQYVPATKRSRELLEDFLATNTSIAIAIDEYGGTAGLVTREDLLEELFGDIQDEFDREYHLLRRASADTFVAAGRTPVDALYEELQIALPPGDYETLAGYLLDRLGMIPTTGDEAALDGYRFTILSASRNRIELVRIAPEKGEALGEPPA